ncbi:outer membrane beta-barrel protein [Formosa sp. PL04]|uniref:outer membrane beta-barrel protein n=1 Tax=Formosa sp. PL04 TaxID=3081755 RepID=UPI0029812ABA|nr:outer membrane beta-barrel protein [Formosa sp. PL04]MDW5288927.1 outer membrane beta-barrel protein [Formosa sp. PL04]
MKKQLALWVIILLTGYQAQSQVLISLLFGDKLNSPNVEFGLEGGVNFSGLEGIPSNYMSNFDLGFYFDININKEPIWKFYTGVIVKSTMGSKDIAVYSLDNTELDELFEGGSVQRKINYFNVPLVIKRQIHGGFYGGLGVMLGLRSKAYDYFLQDIEAKDDLTYKLSIKDNIAHLDAGLLAGLSYDLGNKPKGLSLHIKYYYGLVNINNNNAEPKQYNRSVYLGLGIPIGGVSKKGDKKPEEKKESKKEKKESKKDDK